MTRRARRRASSVRPAWTWSAPQQSPPGPASAAPTPAALSTRSAAACTGRSHASMTQPVIEPHIVARRVQRRRPHGHGGKTQSRRHASRNEVHPLCNAECARSGEEQAVVAERLHAEPLPPRRELPGLGEGMPSALHQPPEGHTRRTGGLAPAALHARVHEFDERGVGRCVIPLHFAHGRDAAAR